MQDHSLAQRLGAEFLGTAFLLATVIGSGIMGERLSGGNVAIALLGNTIPTDLQREGRTGRKRQSFGSFDPAAPDHVGVKDARKAAAKWIADYKNGAKVAAKRGGATLKEAWARYRARLEAKGRQESTIEWYRENLEDGPLKDWLDTQLVSITPEKAAEAETKDKANPKGQR